MSKFPRAVTGANHSGLVAGNFFAALFYLYGTTLGGTLKGEFRFEKSPPSVALVYFSEDSSLGASNGPTVDQKDKKFVNKMLVGRTGCRILFNNSDSLDHNIYANDPKVGVDFDAGLVPPGETSELQMTWKPDAVVKIGCKIHPKMQAYIANISSSYYKIVEFSPTEKEVDFTLDKVPDKFTKIRIWFPKQDPIDAEVKKGQVRTLRIAEKEHISGTLKLTRK